MQNLLLLFSLSLIVATAFSCLMIYLFTIETCFKSKLIILLGLITILYLEAHVYKLVYSKIDYYYKHYLIYYSDQHKKDIIELNKYEHLIKQ
jgi:hypothetical protein